MMSPVSVNISSGYMWPRTMQRHAVEARSVTMSRTAPKSEDCPSIRAAIPSAASRPCDRRYAPTVVRQSISAKW
eukprot:scaffold4358_cov137-Isochrysis_galbana.AAC.3